MRLTKENAFVGAKVKFKDKELAVVKVNDKSFYATEMPYTEYLDKLDKKFKSMTFKEFCKLYEIEMYKYSDDFEIDEKELSRKEIATINQKESSFKIESSEKKQIAEMVEFFKSKKRSIRLFQFNSNKKTIRFIEVRDNNYLLNIDNTYVLYSMDTGETVKLCSVFEINFKEIPWNKLSVYSEGLAA